MSQKAEKPTLSGQRIKTRKRDEKEKHDPTAFRDAILQGLNDAGTDLEQVSRYLDSAGSKLNYRRYAEPLLDILFAGGILAPGGTIIQDAADSTKPWRTDVCVFKAQASHQSLKAYYEVFHKLIRRYKYLEKGFEEELKKLIMFLKGFGEEERKKLGLIVGILLANGLGNASCLAQLFEDHLVKDGIALAFATDVFRAWLQEKDMKHIASVLRRSHIGDNLVDLLPINKRTQENFAKHFQEAGLADIVEYQRAKASTMVKKDLQRKMEEMIKDEEPVPEMIVVIKDYMVNHDIPEHEMVVMVWGRIMNAIEWNKKDELVAEQALRHIKVYTPLLAALTESGRSESALINKVQEVCYGNTNLMKVFQKIVILFYKMDILSEDAILKWYKDASSGKGKTMFLDQIKSFVEWLQSAEEEDSEEEEDEQQQVEN